MCTYICSFNIYNLVIAYLAKNSNKELEINQHRKMERLRVHVYTCTCRSVREQEWNR